MSFSTMQAELRGAVPKAPPTAAATWINRAWRIIRESNLWSFQLYESGWIAPPLLTNTGTVTTVRGSNEVHCDATATAAITACSTLYSLVTQRQFRIGAGGIYSIWGWDDTNPNDGVLTLDRAYGEASVSTTAYRLYQCYYSAPYLDHLTFLSIRDMLNFRWLETEHSRAELDQRDPQRMATTAYPIWAVPYTTDLNPVSATVGRMLFELWGAPTYSLNWQLYGIRRGVDLVLPTDTLPLAVGEDCVLAKARTMAYQWAEANRDLSPRSSGPDFKFLMGAAQAEHRDLLQRYRKQDRELVDNWFFVRKLPGSAYKLAPYYNSQAGAANPGPAW